MPPPPPPPPSKFEGTPGHRNEQVETQKKRSDGHPLADRRLHSCEEKEERGRGNQTASWRRSADHVWPISRSHVR